MTKSKVYYFLFEKLTPQENAFKKLRKLFESSECYKLIKEGDFICIKLHFGEEGNFGFIQPLWIKPIVDFFKENKTKPYLTDTNTIYYGSRHDGVLHILTAYNHGFLSCNCPIIIADGIKGEVYEKVCINQKHFKEVIIGKLILACDFLVCVSHFKGHCLCGFGGALKNLGMGCAAKSGKYKIHTDLLPKINTYKCQGCGFCIQKCPQKALSLVDNKVFLDEKICVGCGECISLCQNKAINIDWIALAPEVVQERIVEYAYGVLSKVKKRIFINFLMQFSPNCDCCGFTEKYIIPDVGVFLSYDPVALDKACVDFVNQQEGIKNSLLKANFKKNQDKIKGLYPNVDYTRQLEYAVSLGMGNMEYELEEV